MKKTYRNILSGMVTIAAFLLLSLCSCHKESTNRVLLKKSQVGAFAGSFFIEIYSEFSWTLSVECDGKPWARLSTTKGTGTRRSIICSYDENTSNAKRKAVIRAEFGNGEVLTSEFVQKIQVTGGEGTILPEDSAYPGLVSDVVPGYMELPAVFEESACAFITHEMSYASYDSRNFSIFYDAANMLSRWVAYPLNINLIGTGTRSDMWNIWDPKVPREYQPSTQFGWGFGNDWSRGHQLPSADRLRSGINEMTFYPTNMTIQDSRHNSGIWSTLEGKVRTWASGCDTLYVVTGVVPSSSTFRTDKEGHYVNVPDAYWKALLMCDFSSAENGTITDCSTIAFYIDHYDFDGTLSSFAMSVSELEDILNMDFFINLPEKWAAVEKDSDISKWGL